jgi:hypothetical protein
MLRRFLGKRVVVQSSGRSGTVVEGELVELAGFWAKFTGVTVRGRNVIAEPDTVVLNVRFIVHVHEVCKVTPRHSAAVPEIADPGPDPFDV